MSALGPGLYPDVPAERYHADPCPVPSLSHSIAAILLAQSPLHAWHAHPRLNDESVEPREVTATMDFGSALHKLMLGRGGDIEEMPFANYKKDAAQERRDEARQFGRIPILEHVMPRLRAATDAALAQMRDHPDCADFFASGQSEAVMVWREGETWCRAMVDRLPDSTRAPIYDIKATDLSAAPGAWERRMVSAYRMQGPFYERGACKINGRLPSPTRFVVVEMKPPHAISVMCSAPSLQVLGVADVERALAIWERCMATGQWPGYPPMTAHIEAPPWLLTAADEQAIRNEFMEAAQ